MGGLPAETTEIRGFSSRKPGVGPDLPAAMPSPGFPHPIRAAAWPMVTHVAVPGAWEALAGQALGIQHVGIEHKPRNQSGWLQI